jgi:hypothetical protein
LEIFFKDSYRVKLNAKRKNNDIVRSNSFGADDIKLNKIRSQNGGHNGNGVAFNSKGKAINNYNSMNSEFDIEG